MLTYQYSTLCNTNLTPLSLYQVTGALDCQYQVDSYESDTLITRKGRELSIVTLDDDLDNLR